LTATESGVPFLWDFYKSTPLHASNSYAFRDYSGLDFGSASMLDVVFLAAGFGFLAVTLLYTHLCARI
jgi:hypothetical protein